MPRHLRAIINSVINHDLRIKIRNDGSNMIDTRPTLLLYSKLIVQLILLIWKWILNIFNYIRSTSTRACLRGGFGLKCLRVGLLGSWLSWLHGGVRLKALCLFLEWWNRPIFYFPNCPYWPARLLTYCAAWLVAGKSAHFDKSMLGRMPLRHGTRGFLWRKIVNVRVFNYFKKNQFL